MADKNTEEDRAGELIAVFDKEWGGSEDSNFRNIYQEVADVMFPRENQITTEQAKGEEKGRHIADTTGMMASIDMASGLSINLFPPGDKFYNVLMEDPELNKVDAVKRKLGQITEISHEKRANSNFMLQANETVRSLGTFGTGCMFSKFKKGVGLVYTDYDIGMYTFLENEEGMVDTVMLEFPYTAKQAWQRWGEDAGVTVKEKMEDSKTSGDEMKFVWIVRPRDLEKQQGEDSQAMPFESIYISRTDTVIVEEGGFEEFPFQVPRWTKSSSEKWGRGVGTMAIGPVSALQTEKQALTDCGELHNNPPKEVLETYEGVVGIKPGDLNHVGQMGSIKAIEQQALGNFVITEKVIEMDREEVRKMFFNQAFNQLEQLKGDRRNELEIRSRLAEGLRKLVMPVNRIQTEWLTGLVTRDIGLLHRAGAFGELPPEMENQKFKIEYVGRLALELQAAASMGWLRWVQEGAEIEAIVPGTLDNVRIDEGYQRRGRTLGVSIEDMATEGEIKDKRERRAAKEKAALDLQIASVAGPAYQAASKKAEEGSPAAAAIG